MDANMMVPHWPPGFSYEQPPYTYPPGVMGPMMMMPFPGTPTSSMFPDTTVKSGSEFGDTPPSSGSSSNQQRQKKFKSPEEEKRYRMKRTRNNEAAKKSRKSRKEKETCLMVQNKKLNEDMGIVIQKNNQLEHAFAQLKEVCTRQELLIQQLQAQLGHPEQQQFNNENINPALFDMKPPFGMFPSQ